MARKRRKLEFENFNVEYVERDFQRLGEDAKNWLELIITSDKMASDPYSTAYNLGRENLAREILGYSHGIEETAIVKNLEA